VPPRRFTRADFARPAIDLAPALLGAVLVHHPPGSPPLRARIVETEAYTGPLDRACHAFANRRTPRTEPMFARPGTTYVYFTYGMHHCFNIVCGKVGEPTAVLIRAAEPLEGLDNLRTARTARPGTARHNTAPPPDAALLRGPGNLCRALGLTLAHNALDLATHPALFVERANLTPAERASVRVTPRIGVAGAGQEWAAAPLRWVLSTSPAASGTRAQNTGPGIASS
jgi:DNA-3-methyladenine glycosylase